MSPHDDALLELASLHGLGLVPAGECASINEHLKSCAECRAAFAESAALAGGLAQSVAAAPPAALRARILRAVVPAKSAPLLPSAPRPRRAWWIPAALIAAALIALAVWTHGFQRASQRPVAQYPQRGVTAIRAWTAKCTVRPCAESANVIALSSGMLQLRAVGLKALPRGKVYQAWVIPPNSKKPLPEPTFKPDRLGNGEVQFAGSFVRGMVIAVTIEPPGGSKAPTSAPLLVAALN